MGQTQLHVPHTLGFFQLAIFFHEHPLELFLGKIFGWLEQVFFCRPVILHNAHPIVSEHLWVTSVYTDSNYVTQHGTAFLPSYEKK